MGTLVHTTRARIERIKGPVRRVYLEHFKDPFYYGVHGGIKEFYGIEPDEEHPATLDHMIAAVAG